MESFQHGDVQLSYEVVGSGPPVVLLHAFPFDRTMWDDNVPALAARHRVIRVDFRGFGDSTLGAGAGYSIADLADDVAALLDHLKIPMASVMGLSMGGYVALAFAARHAPRLGALVLADTKVGADSPEARTGRDEAIAKVRSGVEGLRGFLDGMAGRLLGPDASAELLRRVRGLMTERAEAVAAALAALRDRPDRTPGLPGISAPTLVLVGAEDKVTPPSEAAILARGITGAELRVIDRAGHLPNLEERKSFDELVCDFLEREP